MDCAASSPEEVTPHQREVAGEIVIRLAEIVDAPVLAELMGELGYPTRTAEMEMRLDTILKHPGYRTFVAVIDGGVAGMIGTAVILTHEHNSPGGRILALVVSDKARRRGIGRALIAAAEADFAAKNIRRIALNTRFHREQAHLFYENLGYARNGFRFVKELEQLAD
ncbi:MAG: GNAT family N-acetyltransferase [Chthoniobacterales bacterium]